MPNALVLTLVSSPSRGVKRPLGPLLPSEGDDTRREMACNIDVDTDIETGVGWPGEGCGLRIMRGVPGRLTRRGGVCCVCLLSGETIGSSAEGSPKMGMGKGEALWLSDEDGSAGACFGVIETVSTRTSTAVTTSFSGSYTKFKKWKTFGC